ETRRELRSGEAVSQKIVSSHPIASVEGGKLVGERRRRELGHAHPIGIILNEAASRAMVAIVTITQRPLAIAVNEKLVLSHFVSARHHPSVTAKRICAAFKATKLSK